MIHENLKHENVLNQVAYFEAAQYVSSSNIPSNSVFMGVYELCLRPCLVDVIKFSGVFEEKFAKFFFRQFMLGLSYIHS